LGLALSAAPQLLPYFLGKIAFASHTFSLTALLQFAKFFLATV